MNDDRLYWLGFSAFPGIGPVRFALLLHHFGSAKAIWLATKQDLISVGLGEKLTSHFLSFRQAFSLTSYSSQLHDLHIVPILLTDPQYPKLLHEISDAPFVLYVKGKRKDGLIPLDKNVAVVGTRQVSQYGASVTKTIVESLVSYGCTIISGMAYGVDAVAHETAIACGGKTIAVLGCGVDIIAPSVNSHIYRALTEDGHGAVVSEMPLGLRPTKGLFPARNRIISGLSLGVVVTEGADDSGALITARNAGEQGREVFAVPGPITSRLSAGPSRLIQDGATLITSALDIVTALGLAKPHAFKNNKTSVLPKGTTDEETKLLSLLGNGESFDIDTLVRESGLTAGSVAATISVLELRGVIRNTGEQTYTINE